MFIPTNAGKDTFPVSICLRREGSSTLVSRVKTSLLQADNNKVIILSVDKHRAGESYELIILNGFSLTFHQLFPF